MALAKERMLMRPYRVYLDTSVLGGAFDAKFEEDTKALLELHRLRQQAEAEYLAGAWPDTADLVFVSEEEHRLTLTTCGDYATELWIRCHVSSFMTSGTFIAPFASRVVWTRRC